jgi:hypothetical protein
MARRRLRQELASIRNSVPHTLAASTHWVDPIDPLFGAVGSIPIPITQSYRYEGRDGRISARQTRAVVGVGSYAFLTELEWTRQGNLDLLRYPRCLQAAWRRVARLASQSMRAADSPAAADTRPRPSPSGRSTRKPTVAS